MARYKSDEELKKSTNQGDIDNYNLIQKSKNAYLEAEKIGDTKGMEKAHNEAEAIRAVYGYQTDSSGNPLPETPVSQNTPNAYSNSYFGADTYEKINKMNDDGFNAYKSLVESNVAENTLFAGRAKEKVNQNYENSYKSLQNEQDAALKKLPENMAKLGLYGSGAGETAVSNIRSDYLGKIKSLEESKNNALADIDMQIESIKRNGATQLANYYAQMMNEKPEQFLRMLQLGYGEEQDNKNWDYMLDKDAKNEAWKNREWDYTIGKDKQNTAFNEAQLAASYGNFQPLVDLGLLTPEQAAKRTAEYNTPKVSSGGGGSGSSSRDKELLKSEIDSNISHWLYSVKGLNGEEYMYNGWNDNTNPIYAAKDKINNPDVIAAIKQDLISAGYTSAQANSKIAEYKKSIANQIATIEGNDKTTEDIMRRYGW